MKATKNIKTVWVAAVAYMADTREVTNKEVPDYDLSQLLRLESNIRFLNQFIRFFIVVIWSQKVISEAQQVFSLESVLEQSLVALIASLFQY